jgi:hypothetical protein
MKRFLIFALAVAALSFPAVVTAAKPTDPVKGPACGNIDLSVDYTFDPGATSATVAADLTTVAPSCQKATYIVYVFDASGENELKRCTYLGDGVTSAFQRCSYTSATAEDLCVYATSEGDDGHVIDVAPNQGCDSFGEPLQAGSSGATGFH